MGVQALLQLKLFFCWTIKVTLNNPEKDPGHMAKAFYILLLLWLIFNVFIVNLMFSNTLLIVFSYALNKSVSHSVMSNSLWPHGLYSPPGFSVMEFSNQEYWSGHSLL